MIDVGIDPGFFESAVVFRVRALNLECDELVNVGLRPAARRSRMYSGVMSCTRMAIEFLRIGMQALLRSPRTYSGVTSCILRAINCIDTQIGKARRFHCINVGGAVAGCLSRS